MNDQSKIFALAKSSARFFKLVGGLRTKYDIDYEEILIFLGLGRLNFDDSLNLMFVKPTSVVSLAGYMGIPRETLRRKLARLEEKELVQRSNYGFVVKDLNSWRRLAEMTGSEAAE
jgi:DNA-binding MarR family transcriptional regulator